MYPVLLRIGPVTVYSYTVLLDLGLICGLAVACWAGQRYSIKPETVIDAALYVVIAGIVGARLHYVALNWAYFVEKPIETLFIWRGGLAFHGALLGGGLALWIYTALGQLPFWPLADVAAPGLALGGALGWLGCLTNGCAYGSMGKGFLAYDLPDVYGVSAPRFATQAVGSAWNLAILALIWALIRWGFKPIRIPGVAFLIYLLLYCGGDFLLGFTRGDETLFLGPWRVAQVIDGIGVALAAILMAYLWYKAGKETPPEMIDVSR
ncbi:MAG: prolipoprotein diacylglyceryl transferase [Anaerolineae bacterium]